MTLSRNKTLSGLLAAIYVLVAVCFGGVQTGFKIAAFVILPLGCIWFSEPMGGYVGPVWGGAITHPTPAVLVCFAGWLLLLLPVIIGVVYLFTKG